MSKKYVEKIKSVTDKLEDEEIIRRVMAGETDAYGILVIKYRQKIFNLIGRLVYRADDVEDLAQEVFLKAFRKIGSFRFQSSFFTWLYSITLNTCRNYFRGQKPAAIQVDECETAEIVEQASSSETPEEAAHRLERARMVREAMENLPPEQKEALIMCDLEGLSYQDISDILEIPIGTVRSRIFRARLNLRGLLPEEFRRE